MKRELHEHLSLIKRPVRGFVIGGLAFVVLMFGLGEIILAIRNLTPATRHGLWWAIGAFVLMILLYWTYIELRWRRQEQVTWFVTDGGLQSISPSGEEKMIPWESIDEMTPGPSGLSIKWRETNARSSKLFQVEFSDCLHVNGEEALRLIGDWQIRNPGTGG